uniref:Uncharacterized protein n=1 Tax=Panagrolaimus sp. JU765 TaxID=591449 RepID=A0AC34Q704_9BILA
MIGFEIPFGKTILPKDYPEATIAYNGQALINFWNDLEIIVDQKVLNEIVDTSDNGKDDEDTREGSKTDENEEN